MTTEKKIGIWMDHSSAHMTEFSTGQQETQTILSKFTHQDKVQSLSKGESLMHHKEQHEQAEYYKLLGNIIKNYEDVILFGPTNAKVELMNVLKEDQHFAKIKIEIRQTDKMTEHQQHVFINEYFTPTA